MWLEHACLLIDLFNIDSFKQIPLGLSPQFPPLICLEISMSYSAADIVFHTEAPAYSSFSISVLYQSYVYIPVSFGLG